MSSFGTIVAFALFILFFILLGNYASRKAVSSANKEEDYLLGGRSAGKFVIGLSAGASAASGFVMVGAVGAGYSMGVGAVLLPLAWFVGDWVFWTFFPGRIYTTASQYGCYTVPELLAARSTDQGSRVKIQSLAAIMTIVFVGMYAVGQLLAAGKTVAGAFSVEQNAGVVIAAAAILLYCAKGGLKASIVNNFAQGIIMLLTTIGMLVTVVIMQGGLADALSTVRTLDASLLQPFSGYTSLWLILVSLLGFAAAAFSFDLSTPQFIVRLLAGRSIDEAKKAKWVYLSFMQITWICMVLFGVFVHGFLPALTDPEQALAVFATQELPPWINGIVLGGVFSAIASTLDAQILVISSALTVDIAPRLHDRLMKLMGNKIQVLVTIMVGTILVVLASNVSSSVYTLIIFSATALSGGFAPTLLVVVFGWQTTPSALKLTLLVGIATALLWRFLGYSDIMLEALPGLVAGLIAHWVWVKCRHGVIKPECDNKAHRPT